MRRRSRFDPLAPAATSHWLVVSTLWHETRASAELPPGTDLRAAMTQQLERLAADGWAAESDHDWGVVFVRRGAERLEIGLRSIPPDAPTVRPALLSGW